MPDTSKLIWLFFRFRGRVSRAAYFLAGLFLAIVQAFLLYRFTLAPQDSAESQVWALAFWLAMLASLWSNVALGVYEKPEDVPLRTKRLHDFGKPGIIAAALFIPVISIVAFVALCLFPGDPGPNRYGDRPNAEL